jgi:hypothetical protein
MTRAGWASVEDAGGHLYLCGNGGSHADSVHIASELVKSYAGARPLSLARLSGRQWSSGGLWRSCIRTSTG